MEFNNKLKPKPFPDSRLTKLKKLRDANALTEPEAREYTQLLFKDAKQRLAAKKNKMTKGNKK